MTLAVLVVLGLLAWVVSVAVVLLLVYAAGEASARPRDGGNRRA